MWWNDAGSAWTAKDYGVAALLGFCVVFSFLLVFYLSTKAWVWTIVQLAKHWGFL